LQRDFNDRKEEGTKRRKRTPTAIGEKLQYMHRSYLRIELEVCREGQLSEYELMRERNVIGNNEFMVKSGKLD